MVVFPFHRSRANDVIRRTQNDKTIQTRAIRKKPLYMCVGVCVCMCVCVCVCVCMRVCVYVLGHHLQYGEDELLIEVELGLCALHKRPVSKIRQVFRFSL